MIHLSFRMQMKLPGDWSAMSNAHKVGHIPQIISRWGPFHSNSNLWGERYHIKLLTFARNKNHMLASVAEHYGRDIAGGGKSETEKKTALESMLELPAYLQANPVLVTKGKGTRAKIPEGEMPQIQKLWRKKGGDDDYRALMDRFDSSTNKDDFEDIKDWRPLTGEDLTIDEIAMLNMTRSVQVYTHAHVRVYVHVQPRLMHPRTRTHMYVRIALAKGYCWGQLCFRS